MTFAEKVRELRIQKKLTQEDLGKLIGISKRSILKYERGEAYPRSIELWKKLANALEVDVNYLRTENEMFMEDVGNKYGSRGMRQAKLIMDRTAELFAGGSLSEDDQDAFMKQMQQIYMDAKENAKKYTPKKYRKNESAADTQSISEKNSGNAS